VFLDTDEQLNSRVASVLTMLKGGHMLRDRAGLRQVLAISAAVLVSGCGIDGLLGGDGGRVRVVVSRDGGGTLTNLVKDSVLARHGNDDDDDDNGARFFRFQTANVTLSSVLVRTEDGELVDLDVDLPISVDLVRIDGGKQIVLPDGILPVDNYDQVVLVITAVQATREDGTVLTIEPPGGGWTAVVPVCPFEVTETQTAVVGLALNVRNSFLNVGNWWGFEPRFRGALARCETAE
jgi:hypothetical protein